MNRHPWPIVPMVLALISAGLVAATAADDAPPSPREESGASRLKEMAALARLVTVHGPGSGAPASMVPEPIVRYDDQPRRIEDGTLWIFGGRGRPSAALKVEIYAPGHALHGLVATAPGLISAEGADGWQWDSTKPGVELRPVPQAPPPAESGAGRLAQMKALARRFSGHQIEPPPRRQLYLRLLPKPIHRYDDPEAGLLDGAIFSLANGTNPDVLLLLEARRPQAGGPPTWQYGLARLGGAELVVNLDGAEVWRVAKAFPPARRETYMNRIFPRTPAGAP